MKREFEHVVKIVLLGWTLSGCSVLRDAIFERESKLAPLQSAMLGQTRRDEIIKQLGPPQEIDERWFDTFRSEVLF
ncbi:MAG: hypothetical protein HGB17_12775, partial [Syntrophobacteraceae bacterium]|nr:hypothetical protein [Syntrophobacteraceae bacterium]